MKQLSPVHSLSLQANLVRSDLFAPTLAKQQKLLRVLVCYPFSPKIGVYIKSNLQEFSRCKDFGTLVTLPFNIGITSVIHIIMYIVLTSNKSMQWEILSQKRKRKI